MSDSFSSATSWVSDAFSGIGDAVSQGVQDLGTGLASVDKAVGSTVGWPSLAALAAAPFTGGGSLAEMMAADASELAAQGIGEAQIADIMAQSYGIDQYAASNIAGMALGGSSASDIAGVLASDYGPQMAGLGGQAASASSVASNVGNLVKYAKTGADIIGGVGKIAGGAYGLSQGRQIQPGLADPNSQYRPQYAAQLSNLIQNPNSVTQTPGYQFRLSQGLQGLQAQQASQGRLVSGGALLQGQQFGQNLASQSYNDQVNTLAQLSGATQSPAQGAGAMANIANTNLGTTLGGWQSIAGGVGNLANPLQTLYSMYNQPSPNPTV